LDPIDIEAAGPLPADNARRNAAALPVLQARYGLKVCS